MEELKEEIKKYKQEENPIIRQLREHFKALREELGEMEYEDEGDDIDIDNMSYEVPPPPLSNCWNWKNASARFPKASLLTNSKSLKSSPMRSI